ncbi:MAG: SIMPL domain-containing protein [candidate division Zixibacteria bacterium]|nr:SIMPL domain-containing protein [candidate division Zixibacteria bacterium]MDD5425162.1 SIMPL domain-containing protein [candidate division Zixibacteria bacterium]
MSLNELTSKGSGLIWGSLILGLSLVACALIVSSSFVRIKGFGRTISVTGAANKTITSNYAIWEGNISVTAPTVEAISVRLKDGFNKVEAFLRSEGFETDMYEWKPAYIYKNYNREGEVSGYSLNQTIRVEMEDVYRITELAHEASRLIEQGVEFNSSPPQYLFTGLDSLKLEMIQAATENAKLRAQQLASTTNRAVGPPTSAQVGVFQIRPRHSQEVSGMGMSDISSIDKEIVSTVHISFLID